MNVRRSSPGQIAPPVQPRYIWTLRSIAGGSFVGSAIHQMLKWGYYFFSLNLSIFCQILWRRESTSDHCEIRLVELFRVSSIAEKIDNLFVPKIRPPSPSIPHDRRLALCAISEKLFNTLPSYFNRMLSRCPSSA